MADTHDTYLPGLYGLDWTPQGDHYVAETEREFVDLYFAWKRTLTEIGYTLTKIDGRWVAGFRPGVADKPTILATLLRIRTANLQKLGLQA